MITEFRQKWRLAFRRVPPSHPRASASQPKGARGAVEMAFHQLAPDPPAIKPGDPPLEPQVQHQHGFHLFEPCDLVVVAALAVKPPGAAGGHDLDHEQRAEQGGGEDEETPHDPPASIAVKLSSSAPSASSTSAAVPTSGGAMRSTLPYKPPLPIKRPRFLLSSSRAFVACGCGVRSEAVSSLTSSTPCIRPLPRTSPIVRGCLR